MIDKNPFAQSGGLCGKPTPLCCVNVNKIFDSARDKDCLEDVRVYLCDCAQEVIDRSSAVRCKNVEVVWTNISIEPVPFNRGYYQVTIRYYFCITLESCVCGGRTQEIKGLAVYDKKIILFGSEKNVSMFKSDPENNSFCTDIKDIRCDPQSTLPTVVVEVASPICLDTKVVERCRNFGNCCINIDAIPGNVRNLFEGSFIDGAGVNEVFVSIGIFSVIRMERPVQLLIPASAFCIPDKDSTPAGSSSDPCNVFSKMCFPINEFFPYADDNEPNKKDDRNGCCGK